MPAWYYGILATAATIGAFWYREYEYVGVTERVQCSESVVDIVAC